MTPTQIAKDTFGTYAAMGATEFPIDSWERLQVELCRWQNRNFDAQPLTSFVLGAVEELGELSHAVLKNAQSIRGFEDEEKFREAAGDAIADATIFLMQAATVLRLDFQALVHGTAAQVMKRDWTKSTESDE